MKIYSVNPIVLRTATTLWSFNNYIQLYGYSRVVANVNTFLPKGGQLLLFLRLYDKVFSFQNNPKNLDPSYKTDLDMWNC